MSASNPEDLVELYLDDALSDREASDLYAWLRSDRANVRLFVSRVHEDRSIRTQAVALELLEEVERTGVSLEVEDPATDQAGASVEPWEGREVRPIRRRGSRGPLRPSRPPLFRWLLRFSLVGVGVVLAWFAVTSGLKGSGDPMGLAVVAGGSDGGAAWAITTTTREARPQAIAVQPPRSVLRRGVSALESLPFDVTRQWAAWAQRQLPSLAAGSVIETRGIDGCQLTFDRDGTSLSLMPYSTLRIVSLTGGRHLELLAGGMTIRAAPQPAGKPLRLSTPTSRVTVVGTALSVLASSKSTRVFVTEGRVEMVRGDRDAPLGLSAGQFAVARPADPLAVQAIGRAGAHSGAGTIRREVWEDLPGRSILDLTGSPRFQAQPTRVDSADRLEFVPSLPTASDNYGVRYRGYLHPPVTGEYTFWLTADDAAELWLSPTDQPDQKQRLCSVVDWNGGPHNWWQTPTQESGPVRLEAGRRYYVELLHKEAGGDDYCSVAWQPSGLPMEVISGVDLSPWIPEAAAARQNP